MRGGDMLDKTVIIGAGAAGLMAAITAAKRGKEVLLVEKNQRPARKVMITGKGRCNVTNNCDLDGLLANIPKNPRFLYSAFSAFSVADTMEFFEKSGVPLKTERGNRVFHNRGNVRKRLQRTRAGSKFLRSG